MIAGFEAMTMLTPDAFDSLNALGQRLRSGIADIIETRGMSWQVSGQGSVFKLHPHPRPLLDYTSSLPTPDEKGQADQFYMAMLGRGVVLSPDLAGALSTPMTEHHIDDVIHAADQVFGMLD
jgi:glutamate-1-semialdehyde 2,1-aminomutase